MSHSTVIAALPPDVIPLSTSLELLDRAIRAGRLTSEIKMRKTVSVLDPTKEKRFVDEIEALQARVPMVTSREWKAINPMIEMLSHALEAVLAPFDENGTFFKDGSRWDWWQIGGRFSGRFHGYDVVRRHILHEDELVAWRKTQLEADYDAIMADPALKDFSDDAFFVATGFERGRSKLSYMEAFIPYPVSASAFVRDQTWYENERMGWFGGTQPTECEIKAEKTGEAYDGRCIATADGGAKIISYGDNDVVWARRFWGRFIQRLDPQTLLVLVDYHV